MCKVPGNIFHFRCRRLCRILSSRIKIICGSYKHKLAKTLYYILHPVIRVNKALKSILLYSIKISEWVSDCCLTSSEQFFSYIMGKNKLHFDKMTIHLYMFFENSLHSDDMNVIMSTLYWSNRLTWMLSAFSLSTYLDKG